MNKEKLLDSKEQELLVNEEFNHLVRYINVKGKMFPKGRFVITWTKTFLYNFLGFTNDRYPDDPFDERARFSNWKDFMLNQLDIDQQTFNKINETKDVLVKDLIQQINSIS